MIAIQTENINFAYQRSQPVLSGINIQVPIGSIYGFLGKNGAGKSTTLRVILGLLKPQQGSISIMGENIKKTYPNHLNQIGSLIENPALYNHLNAEDNLIISCKYFQIPKNNIDRVLEMVNLKYARKKKVKQFSTGMKQRLGLAIALLQDPQILILDEPTNGLDPQGMIELRTVLEQLKAQNKTILLSSHILSEVEKIANKIGIIKDGKMVFEGDLDELQKMKHLEVHIKLTNADKAIGLLNAFPTLLTSKQTISIECNTESDLPGIINLLVQNGFDIYQVIPKSKDLEELFISVTDN